MTEYQKRRTQIWMIQVRKRGSNEEWSPTGATYFNSREHTLSAISKFNWPNLEYRAVKYLPEPK